VSSTFRWSVGAGGDPFELVTHYLSEAGLGVRELGRTDTVFHPIDSGTVCGAALYVSAAAASVTIGGPAGAPSPVPGIPDVFAQTYVHGLPPARGDSSPADWRLGEWRDSWTRAEHAAAVGAVRAAIGRGDVYQVNVVGHASAPYSGDPGPALARVAGLAGARYGGVLADDGWAGWAGSEGRAGWALATASPETLVEVRAGRVITRPIKGTRSATETGRRELLASAKERAEHVMIVDLARNDLSRLPGTGPVRVDELFAVRKWSGLWQAESVVSAAVTGPLGLPDLLRAICPGGSVTGAPKRAALDEIARLEPVGRGVSMGALGWIGTDHVDLGLSIRTVAATEGRVHVWAGGGITWGSDEYAEVDEAAAKAAPIRAALSPVPLGRPSE
jgi:para-aminobenzoate synthetase component 1